MFFHIRGKNLKYENTSVFLVTYPHFVKLASLLPPLSVVYCAAEVSTQPVAPVPSH